MFLWLISGMMIKIDVAAAFVIFKRMLKLNKIDYNWPLEVFVIFNQILAIY